MYRRIKKFSSIKTIRRLYPFVLSEKKRLVIAVLLMAILTAIEVASPLFIGSAVDTVLGNDEGFFSLSLNTIVRLLFAGALIRLFLVAYQKKLTGEIGERVASNIRNGLWKHLLRLPVAYSKRRGSGKLLLRFTGDARSVQRLITSGLIRFSQDILLGIGILSAMIWINWRMAAATGVILPFFGLTFMILNPRLRKASRRVRGRRSRISGYLHERVAGMAAVKSCVQQDFEQKRLASLQRGLVLRRKRFAEIGGWMEGTSTATLGGTGALILLIAGGEISVGRLTGGSLVAFYTLLGLLLPVFKRLATVNRYLQEASISLQRVDELLSAVPEDTDGERELKDLQVRKGEISVNNITFGYETENTVLQDISLQAKRGEIVALVGENGAGKSTLLNLLMGFQRPQEGEVLIDGQNLTNFSLDSIRREIGLVTQNSALFSGTILENISYGGIGEITEEKIHLAAELTGVSDFVSDLPDGWETKIGSEGGTLSGGQRQRISLARALVSDPMILILDEATSALDVKTEIALTETLQKLARRKTIIVAAHRLPTLRAADRIYVLENGRICEIGTHLELLRKEGIYHRLFADEEMRLSRSVLTLAA